MGIIVLNKRISLKRINIDYPQSSIIDVTSNSNDEFMKFSPFYPHGNIPIPFSDGYFSQTVEGIWQGLKVFENKGIDPSKFAITNMKNIKRSSKKNGRILGHQKGVNGKTLLGYIEARLNIYLPSYNWILKIYLNELLDTINIISKSKTVILLDYETNGDIHDISKPLSHAYLIKYYLENNFQSKKLIS